ncbi:hypothetical protein SOVF_200150 [Spinacia oleracea]|nr:hypothetical protein SOVF_200150 [Spinacia oleracea]
MGLDHVTCKSDPPTYLVFMIKVMVHWRMSQLSANGPWRRTLVILPLTRAGEIFRCSMKPASRGLLHSKAHEDQAFAQPTWTNSQLGEG